LFQISASILPAAAASPFASLANPKPAPNPPGNRTETSAAAKMVPPNHRTDTTSAVAKMVPESSRRQQPILNPNEPQYIPTSGKFDESSDSFSESDDSLDATGVYSDDEELDDYKETDSPDKDPRETSGSPDKDRKLSNTPPEPQRKFTDSPPKLPRPVFTKPNPEPSSTKPRPTSNLANAYRTAQEPIHIEENVESFRNPWEVCDDDNDKTAQMKSIPQPQRSSTPIKPDVTPTATADNVFAQPAKPSPSFRPASAFASCRTTASVAKKNSEAGTTHGGRNSAVRESGRESARPGLYERRTNEEKEKRREFGESNTSKGPHQDMRFAGGDDQSSRYPSSASDRRLDSVDGTNLTNASRNPPREPMPTQQPCRPTNGTSVFSRPLAESSVRSRTPVRNDSQWERGPQRSSTAMGNSGFDGTYPRNNYSSPQQSSNSRNVYRGDEPSYRQRPEGNNYRANAYDEYNRPRSSASMRFANNEYDERYSGSRRDDNQRWPRDENYHQNDTSGSSRRDDNQRWPKDESFNRSYHGPEPTSRDYDRNRPTFCQSDAAFDERRDRYFDDNTQYRQRTDVFRGNGERDDGGCRSQNIEYPSHSRNASNSFMQPPSREEGDHTDRYRDSSRQSYHNDRGQYGSAPRQDRSPPLSQKPPLTVDQRARLRIIHDFAFLHRHVNNSGYRPLDSLMAILPPDDSVNWVALIKERLPDVEIASLMGSHVLMWNEGNKSGQDVDKSFKI
ncbi:hypothetical protein ANCCAN_14847, partial [Ancylostoma caninum]